MGINYRDTSDIQMLGESKRKRGEKFSCSVFVVPPPSSRSRIKKSARSENVDDLRYIYSNAITHGVAFIEFSAPFWSIFSYQTHTHTRTPTRTLGRTETHKSINTDVRNAKRTDERRSQVKQNANASIVSRGLRPEKVRLRFGVRQLKFFRCNQRLI